MDMMAQFMMGGGGGYNLPWKDPRLWTVRDYDRLGDVLEEFFSRERGRASRAPMCPPPYSAGYGYDPYDPGGRGGGRGGRRKYVPYGEFEELEGKMRRMAEEWRGFASDQDAFLFGTDAERRREAFRQNMLGQLRELMPQLAASGMLGNSAGANGFGGMQNGMGMGMGINPMMGQNMAAMQGMMNGIGGMGALGGLNPAAAQLGALGQMGAMNPQASMPQVPMGPPFMNNNNTPYMDQGYPAGQGPGRMRRPGRGPMRFNPDLNDDDMFDNEDVHVRYPKGMGGRPPWGTPGFRRPSDGDAGPPPRPMPPRSPRPGGSNGGGGATFTFPRARHDQSLHGRGRGSHCSPSLDRIDPLLPEEPVTTMPIPSSPRITRAQYQRPTVAVDAEDWEDVLDGPPYPTSNNNTTNAQAYTTLSQTAGATIRPQRYDPLLRRPSDPLSPGFGDDSIRMTNAATGIAGRRLFPSAVGGAARPTVPVPSTLRPGMPPERRVSFQGEIGNLARSIAEDQARNEADAGAAPGRRDGMGLA